MASPKKSQVVVNVNAAPKAKLKPALRAKRERARYRAEFRKWQASLPSGLERETLLMPEVIAEKVVQEAESLLQAELPGGFAERLAARACELYPRSKHFRHCLAREGNEGREALGRFMRHWTAGWLRREGNPLRKRLPEAFALGS